MGFKIVIDKVASYKMPATLESDKKVTLLYGLNGAGKSTVSNFLYRPNSVEYKECSHHGFDNVETLVYNIRFVRDNFFEIDKLGGIFTLSKANKEVEERIASFAKIIGDLEIERNALEEKRTVLSRSIADLQQNAEEATWPIKTRYSGGDRVLEFCLEGLKQKARLFDHISNLELFDEDKLRPVDVLKKEVEILQGDGARSFDAIPLCIIDKSSAESAAIFNQVILGKADSPVAALITKLNNADWIKEGLGYAEILQAEGSAACPFCQAATLNATVGQLIKDYFDKSFSDAVDLLRDAEAAYQNFAELQPNFSAYFQNPFFEPKLAEFQALHGQLVTTIQANIDKIKQKVKSPSIPVELVSTRDLIVKLNAIIVDVNSKIFQHNEKITNKTVAVAALKAEFWNRCRRDYDGVISGYKAAMEIAMAERNNASTAIDKLDAELKASKEGLVQLQKETVNVDHAIRSINNRLHAMGIDSFSIVKAGENRYRLSRNGSTAEDFQTLSEGEKTVISFIYFIELCKGKKSPTDISGQKIAVIDDPISSLSHVYVFHIGQLIKEEFSNSNAFAHVIILTHSLYFFYELADMRKDRREISQKLLRIIKNDSGSSIIDMKYEEIQNDYQAYWSVVMDKAQHPALVANCMRNIIEYFFNFVRKRDLNNVFQMPALKDVKHQAFCRFMNRESHSLGQNIFDYKEFDYEKFKEGFRLVFHDAGFAEHYAEMAKL